MNVRCALTGVFLTGAEVVDCSWDGGYGWPRKGDDQFGIDVIWEFFQKNGR